MSVPADRRHNFVFDLELTNAAATPNKNYYRCSYCGTWTDSQFFQSELPCPKRDRRIGAERRKLQRRDRDVPVKEKLNRALFNTGEVFPK